MIKVGMHYAYWNHDWDVDFNPFVDKAADIGFDILEVNVPNLSPVEWNRLHEHARARNLMLTYCIGLPPKYDVASADEATRKNGIEFLQNTAKAMGELGGGKLSGILYSYWPANMPDGESDKRPYLDRSIKSLKEAAKAAEDNNVYFNVEVVNRFEQFLLNTAAEAVAYVQQVGSPNVKILLDTFHMNIEENFVGEAIETAGTYLGHVHIGESNRMPPGYGHIPWDELATALKRIGYDDTMVMEPFLMPGGPVGRDIRVWRDMSVGFDLDLEAEKALRFIRNRLSAA